MEGMSLLSAERDYKVPRNTIRRHNKGRLKTYEDETYLSSDQEEALARELFIENLSEREFHITIDDMCTAAFAYVQKLRHRTEIGPLPNSGCQMEKCLMIDMTVFVKATLRFLF